MKTRLCPPLSPEQAAELQTACLQDLWARLARMSDLRCILCHSPAGAADHLRALLGQDIPCFPQGDGELGERLIAAYEALFSRDLGPLVGVGADSPDLPLEIVSEAVDALRAGRCDVALGPAADGGCTLIGLRRPQPQLFEAIPWSTSGVFSAMRDRCRQTSLRMLALPEWYDVDDALSLTRLRGSVLARPEELPHLFHWFRRGVLAEPR